MIHLLQMVKNKNVVLFYFVKAKIEFPYVTNVVLLSK